MRQVRGILIALLLSLAACGGGDKADPLARARAEAKKVAPDAVLVSIEFSAFGFATGANGIPDMTKAGAPQLALFNFYAPSSGKGLRVVADINRAPLPAEMAKLQEQKGYKDIRVEQADFPYTPFTLPLPDEIGDLDKAIAAAQSTIEEECAGGDPQVSSCRLVQAAELHMHWSGPADQSGTPVWTISFGQNPKTYDTVRRAIADDGHKLYAGGDAQATTLNEKDAQPLQQVDLKVGRDFDALWPQVIEAVQKQDPLYAPYGASLITYLEDVRQAGGRAALAEAHIIFARLTPSLIWDEVEAHVGWRDGSADDAVLFFSAPRRHAMGEPKPTALTADDLPKAAPSLQALLKNFPDGYREVVSSWSEGCEDILTMMPELKMWRCGVMVENRSETDLVFLWLTRPGNPYWRSGRAPLASEFNAIGDKAPKDGWAWWTRVKHTDRWQYFLMDAKSRAADPGFCTTPNTRGGAIEIISCAP